MHKQQPDALLLNSKIEEWMRWDRNEKTRGEVHTLVTEGNVAELERRFMSRIEFGTAGLRGRMAAGISMMNDVVVIQTSQGLSNYLLACQPEVKERGVVVGFDGRHNSKKWAHFLAAAMMRKGIPVYLFTNVAPTPFVAFGVKHLKAVCGVVITASHNPKQDNGYKVYWDNGAQIVSPHDKKISQSILESLEMDDASWDISGVLTHSLRKDPTAEVEAAYFDELSKYVQYKQQNSSCDLKMVYTAMHGVGWNAVQSCLLTFGFPPCIPVKEQMLPDPEFPTVTFPNPEEGKSAMNLAIKTADENNVSFIMANDPDADRLCIAEKNDSSGEWKIFNGNEMAALLGWWCWHCHQFKGSYKPADSCYMVASTVSSKILLSMAELEGFNFAETLTGFKWIANKTIDLENAGKTVLFGFEEAIGFMVGSLTYDKDGVSALGVLYELAAYLNRQGKQLHQQLATIYEKYGHHLNNNSYFICHDKEKIKHIFTRIRTMSGAPDTYPEELGGVKVKYVRDLTTGYDNEQPDNKAILPVSSSSQMITFTFVNKAIVTLRTSGTEPKIKYYSEIRGTGSKLSKEELSSSLNALVEAVINELLEPKKNQLLPKSE